MDNKLSEIQNLIGYGVAKFDMDFVRQFGYTTKQSFYRFLSELGVSNTVKAISNRVDSFDPYFENGRKGWHQRRQREHIKLYIDSLMGQLTPWEFADAVKMFINNYFQHEVVPLKDAISPIRQSQFRSLQKTGTEAEFFFLNQYRNFPEFSNAILEDARLWGDGYDFQLSLDESDYILVEVKGIRKKHGGFRMTETEYLKALEYKHRYCLAVVYNLDMLPDITYVFNPTISMEFICKESISSVKHYHSAI